MCKWVGNSFVKRGGRTIRYVALGIGGERGSRGVRAMRKGSSIWVLVWWREGGGKGEWLRVCGVIGGWRLGSIVGLRDYGGY